jgi:hypothetical protein
MREYVAENGKEPMVPRATQKIQGEATRPSIQRKAERLKQ